MEEKTYLKWYNKIGYGSGDIAGNVVYAFLTSFVMVYLTDTIGLASGIVGTLIAASKLFDGFTDVFFGSLIDKAWKSKAMDDLWLYRLCFDTCSSFCNSYKLGQDCSVCMVLYSIYIIEWCILYSK